MQHVSADSMEEKMEFYLPVHVHIMARKVQGNQKLEE